MIELRLDDQVVQYDQTATVAAYAALKSGGAEDCGCEPCQNFLAQRKNIYPPEFHALAERLGIDLVKEGEAYHCGKDEKTNKHYYGGWFYFVGKMVSPGKKQAKPDNDFGYVFNSVFPRPPEAFKGQLVLALDFNIKLPWVLKSIKEPK